MMADNSNDSLTRKRRRKSQCGLRGQEGHYKKYYKAVTPAINRIFKTVEALEPNAVATEPATTNLPPNVVPSPIPTSSDDLVVEVI